MTDQSKPLPANVLQALGRYDTPTICNALELVAPHRRAIGFTVKPLICPFPKLPPIVGYARTAIVRAKAPSPKSAAEQKADRLSYYTYVGSGEGPRISIIQDGDGPDDAGYGAFWGEVHSAVHKALGCLGVVTNGSIRDIDQWAPGFQAIAGCLSPSHAHTYIESFAGPVNVAGMEVSSGDLIHADFHGAVVIPHDVAAKVPEAADLCARRETPILTIARSPDFTLDKLRAALAEAAEIH